MEYSLSDLYKKKKTDRDIFHELMPFKVREILLVATYYDAYTIDRNEQIGDKIFGEYMQLKLYSAPRFTSVSTIDEALKAMKKRRFDMVILMVGIDKQMPIRLSEKIKAIRPKIPILMLLNNNSDLAKIDKAAQNKIKNIDRVFVWNGDSNIFMAMTKYVEDRKNVANDTVLGGVRVILLVEDSVKYYSRYLPLLYQIIMEQTQRIIEDETTDELQKILKMRGRPKVLLVSSYERAMRDIEKYKDNLLCVISDVQYERNQQDDPAAGVELIKKVREINSFLPTLLQSNDISNATKAKKIGAHFIDKNSETLAHDIKMFLYRRLGFSDFVFKKHPDKISLKARTLQEFMQLLQTVPEESLMYHLKTNGISTWLMARGEINAANKLRNLRIEQFENIDTIRRYISFVFSRIKQKRLQGKVINFDSDVAPSDHYVTRLGKGSLGGKGRGLAFLSNLVENIYFSKIIPEIHIAIPETYIIGVEEFDNFIDNNNFREIIYNGLSYDYIQKLFLEGKLSEHLLEKLRLFVNRNTQPLAIRSSGLFEDSLTQAFSGIYSTYLIPNSHNSPDVRLKQLTDAIKMVYASIFTDKAKSYFNAVNYKIEEEKMAIIIQNVVAKKYDNRAYPHISGVAQSYNFYPFSRMKPEDGFAVLAVGLGMYVAGGEPAFRFCPKFPELQINSLDEIMKESQKQFYAIDLTKTELDFATTDENIAIVKSSIRSAVKDGSLKHTTTVYDIENQTLTNDLNKRGPKIVNFEDILKYNYIPLAKAIQMLLELFGQAMGAPVEIEFAVDLSKNKSNKPTLYLLQIKPLIRRDDDVNINTSKIEPQKLMLLSNKGMGHGRIETIRDVVFVNTEDFDRTKTEIMAAEIEHINNQLAKTNTEYVLIGPGRWGTRDKHTGIPVTWSQISKAKIIVEMGLKEFPLDASLGSHFFHNVTSMNVGYFSVQYGSKLDHIDFNTLRKQNVINKTDFFTHVRFIEPITILMDGKKRTFLICTNKADCPCAGFKRE